MWKEIALLKKSLHKKNLLMTMFYVLCVSLAKTMIGKVQTDGLHVTTAYIGTMFTVYQ